MSARILEGPYKKPVGPEEVLGHLLFNRLSKYKDRICQIDGANHTSETYSSVKLRSVRLAISLSKRGVTKDDVIAICSANTLDNSIPLIAAQFLGAKVSNLDASFSVRHTVHLLKLMEPKIIFVENSALKLIEDSLLASEMKPEIIIFGESLSYPSFTDLVKQQKGEEDFVPTTVDPEETAFLYFSSGTTGLPKAIAHSHRSFIAVMGQVRHCGWDQAILHFSNFYFITAALVMSSCIESGSFRVFCQNPTAERILTIIEKYKVRCIFMSTMLSYELTDFKDLRKFDTSSLRILNPIGEPIAASQLKKLIQAFPGAMVGRLYGMTEVGIMTGFDLEVDREIALVKYTSCGKPFVGIKIKVVHCETRELLGPNQTGEICVLATTLMKGYYHNKQFSSNKDSDGFIETGDIGYYDEDGFLYVVDRIKEMFKYKYYHIVPSFIEGILLEHPSIKEAMVFGTPHEKEGGIPTACIVLKTGCILTESEIDEYLKDKVSDNERLRGGIVFVDFIPKTPSGKMARNEMKSFALKKLNSNFMQL